MPRLFFAVTAVAVFFGTADAQSLQSVKNDALAVCDILKAQIHDVSQSLWDFSETALMEKQSSALLIDVLTAEGFSIESGVSGMETAFVASYGSGKPIVGILAEYDALPGVGNAAVPRREARNDGVTSGQGCGHNTFGSAAVNGAIAVKRLMERHNLPGTVRLYGTPAEETVVGKVYMAKDGLFDDLDAAIEWHPGVDTQVKNQPGRAMNNFEIEFFGQTAHSSADPWNGRSALDAVEMLNYGVNMMREHIKPTARIHYVIPNGGQAPNVVPDYAKVWYYARDTDRTAVESHYERILKIAEGAALATGTTHKVTLITGVHETLLNRPLQVRMQENLNLIGGPRFSEDEQEFGKEMQRFLGLDEDGFKTTVKPLADEPEPVSGGSTDVAEVSQITPTVGFSVATTARYVPWHSWAVAACNGAPAGKRAAVVATKAIALMSIDMLMDETLLREASNFFREKQGDSRYVSPVPADQMAPRPPN